MGRNKLFFHWKRGIAKRAFSLVLVFAMIAALIQTMPGLQTVWAAEESAEGVTPLDGEMSAVVDGTEDAEADDTENVEVDSTEQAAETETEPMALADVMPMALDTTGSVSVAGKKVTFTVQDPDSAKISVRGSFNNWGQDFMTLGEDGIFTYTVELEPDEYEYKFYRYAELDSPEDDKNWDTGDNRKFTVYPPLVIKLHYHRPDGNYTDWDVWMWGVGGAGAGYPLVEEDGDMVATFEVPSGVTSVGFIVRKPDWTKDFDGDRFISVAELIGGTVHIYVESGQEEFTKEYGEDAVKGTKVTNARYNDQDNTVVVQMTGEPEGELEDAFEVKSAEGSVAIANVTAGEGFVYTLAMDAPLDVTRDYKLVYDGNEYEILMPIVYSRDDFEEAYTYEGNDLGATWSQSGTTFKVWAPTATAMSVKLYESGTKNTDDLQQTVSMTMREKGVWEATVEGDLNKTYYTYEVTVGGETKETCDPYARATGVNGDRAMVIDLDSTDPEGWDSDVSPNKGMAYTDAVIYELHVRDFSIDASSGISDANKGKFLGLTETGTTNATGETTGLDYLKDLGVTHIHLLPFYDYGSVDETKLDQPQFNWGYDPKNYNVPEGSYSTDPYNGEVRVKEAKQMIKALHDNNINVVMDVVYNHVQSASEFSFNQLVPGYFSRISDDGKYSNGSGCGNDTASERSMVKKFIVDSVNYWADEYHIDGFRFDLVGLLDTETVNEIVTTVHAKHPDVIFYGEGWTMGTDVTKEGYTMATQVNSTKTPNFAYFSDTMRDMIKGSVFDATGKGYVSGAQGKENDLISCFTANTDWSKNPTQTVNYASCHDNPTLFDKLAMSATDATEEERIKMNNLAAAIYMTAEGIPFIHAGEEILRSKPKEDGTFDENSYSSPDSVNSIKWATLNDEKYRNNRDYYKGLIAFRKEHAALRLTSSEEIAANIKSNKVANNVVMFTINGANTVGESADKIVVIFNSNKAEQDVNLADYGLSGTWKVYINDKKAGTEVLDTITDGHAKVAPISAMVLVQDPVQNETPRLEIPVTSDFSEVIDTAGKVSAGTTITVQMADTTVPVPAAVFNTIQGKDVTICFTDTDGDFTWTINGKLITAVITGPVSLNVELNVKAIPADKVNAIAGTNKTMQVSLTYDGNFNFTARLTLNVGKDYAGKYANLFYDNEKSSALEYQEADRVTADGKVTYTFTHASDYLIVFAEADMKPQGWYDGWAGVSAEQKAKLMQASLAQNAAVTAPKTNDNAPIAMVIMLMMAGAVAVAGAVSKKRKLC